MTLRLKSRHLLPVILVATVLAFQNCSDPAAEDDSATNSSNSFKSSLPFAYEASLDTIAYMSCSRMAASYEKRAFFTFRAGSYTQLGGIGVTPDFIKATKYYTIENKRAAFGDSLANANTRLQLSLRTTADLQRIVTTDSSSSDGKAFNALMTNLSADPLASHLATMKAGDLKHYFPSAESNRLVAGSLRFSEKDENVAALVRSRLENNEALLALTFTNSDSVTDYLARGPIEDANGGISTTKAYGRGHQLTFGTPYGWATGERRVLSGITEVALEKGFPKVSTASWSCLPSMQFVIIRNEDIANVKGCDRKVDNYTTESQRQALDVIRRVLPVEDFFVDVVNRCIVAKSHIASQSCYGNRDGRGPIDYSSKSCVGDACAHYVSVCVKTKK